MSESFGEKVSVLHVKDSGDRVVHSQDGLVCRKKLSRGQKEEVGHFSTFCIGSTVWHQYIV